MVNIFAPTPKINPSVLNSTAGAAMALAKPVIGTRVPAPACFAILSYRLRPVSSADRATSDMDAAVPAISLSSPSFPYQFTKNCPNVQISPPTRKAPRQSFHMGDLGLSSLTIFPYSRSVIFIPPGVAFPVSDRLALPMLDIFCLSEYNLIVAFATF